MNVYDHIAANNRKTVIILCAFPVALFATVFLFAYLLAKTGILSLAGTGVLYYVTPKDTLGFFDKILVQTGALSQALRLTLMVYPWMLLVAFIWIAISYRLGSAMILGMAHARRVTFDENRELFRLVENTAIMAGLPTPEIYLIKDESMNAFATGCKPEEASVALTDGIIKKLNKAELQSVIAHELAHIGNRDTRLMVITVAGIGCFIFFGEFLCRAVFRGSLRSSRNKKGGGTIVLFVIGIVCLLFGYVIAPILRFALSRLREYQADATAVKITRDPDALVRALTKIALDPRVEVLDASPLVGNMCIANPASVGSLSRLYSTHPSIDDRLTALINMMGIDMDKNEAPPVKSQGGKAIW